MLISTVLPAQTCVAPKNIKVTASVATWHLRTSGGVIGLCALAPLQRARLPTPVPIRTRAASAPEPAQRGLPLRAVGSYGMPAPCRAVARSQERNRGKSRKRRPLTSGCHCRPPSHLQRPLGRSRCHGDPPTDADPRSEGGALRHGGLGSLPLARGHEESRGRRVAQSRE